MSLISATPLLGYDQRQLSSRNKNLLRLPRIEHPSKRMNNDEKHSLDIRGRSRDRQGNGKLIRNELLTARRKRSSSLKYNSKSLDYSEPLHDIPENVETIYGEDRDKVRLPIFGKTKNGLFFILQNLEFQVVDPRVQHHHQLIIKKNAKPLEHRKLSLMNLKQFYVKKFVHNCTMFERNFVMLHKMIRMEK
jgi:hypothetical protein